MFFDGKIAERKLYERIETVTVDQAMDMATEARIELQMCANEKGVWDGPTDAQATPWKRVRIEVRNMTKEWIALIDGPVVAWNASMSGEPGQSTMTLVIRDDSIYLNIRAKLYKFENKTDDEVVKELLTKDLDFDKPEIDPFSARPKDRPLKIIKFGTQMDLLLELARPYVRHVYVRPGNEVGKKSVGCVKEYAPAGDAKLPALVLTGPQRNIISFTARSDATQGATFAGAQLDIGKVATTSFTSQWTDVKLIGREDPFVQVNEPEKVEQIDPLDAALYDVKELAQARQQKSSFALVSRGSIRAGCYSGVLMPYELVGVSGVNQKLCTNWLIRNVTHTLNRSEYRQDFTLLSNAVAKVGRDAASMLPGVF